MFCTGWPFLGSDFFDIFERCLGRPLFCLGCQLSIKRPKVLFDFSEKCETSKNEFLPVPRGGFLVKELVRRPKFPFSHSSYRKSSPLNLWTMSSFTRLFFWLHVYIFLPKFLAWVWKIVSHLGFVNMFWAIGPNFNIGKRRVREELCGDKQNEWGVSSIAVNLPFFLQVRCSLKKM